MVLRQFTKEQAKEEVYKLYGITEEEKKIIEESLKFEESLK